MDVAGLTPIFLGDSYFYKCFQSVRKVFDELGSNEKAFWKIPVGINEEKYQFSHNDFIWAKQINELFYTNLFYVLDSQKK